MSDGRYDRQVRLPEVGAEGQGRIESAVAEVCGRDGATVELSYLCRAGVSEIAMLPGKAPEPFVHADWFRFPASRSVGAGSWRALEKIKKVLELAGR